MSIIILGIHFSHNSSACVFRAGTLVSAIQEERLSRIKQDEDFPRQSIRFVLKEAGVNPHDVDVVAVAGAHREIESPYFGYATGAGPSRTVWASRLAASLKGLTNRQALDAAIYPPASYRRYLSHELELLGFDRAQPLYMPDHHLCHAASAVLAGGLERALVVTQDGRGDGLSGSAYVFDSGRLTPVYRQDAAASLAQLYAGTTAFLGFTPLRHEGKITGLAAFGKETDLAGKIEALFNIDETGELHRDNEALATSGPLTWAEAKMVRASHNRNQPYERTAYGFQRWLAVHARQMSREDVAYAIQAATERVMTASIANTLAHVSAGVPMDVCVAGGLFANVKLNQRLRDQTAGVANLFVQPAMGDEGLSVGAAVLAAWEAGETVMPMQHVYLGSAYSEREIQQELDGWSDRYQVTHTDNIETRVAELLYAGKVVGRFNGAMEFGPRALGNRSILIHPANKDINDIVNKRLRRTEFMPFAPSVLAGRAADYFIGYDDRHLTAEWMTTTYDVDEEVAKSIAAVVHVDSTARPQVVREEINPSYFKILSEFDRLSGIGCLVNTSFNMHEEPIVASPADAMRALNMGGVDFLAIGSYLVERR